MMKKVTYLMTMIFAVALLSTSCCKDDPVVPEPTGPITLSELEGVWVSTQYEYDVTYNDCDDFLVSSNQDVLDGESMLITLYVNPDWTLDDNCGDYLSTHGNYFDYDRDAGKLELGDAGIYSYKFDVVSYDRNTGILVLELKHENIGGHFAPIGGKYTLQK